MPELTEEQYEHVALILSELAPVVDDLNDSPANFVRDQIARHEQYGARMFMSPKQIAWLERLHEEHVGTASHAQPSDLTDDVGPGSDGPDTSDPRFNGEADDVLF